MRGSQPSPDPGASQCLSPLWGFAREPDFPPSPLVLSAACGKSTLLGASAWREVSPLLSQAPSAVQGSWALASPRTPAAGPMGNSYTKSPSCLYSPPPKWSPCLVNFYFVVYLEAVKTNPGGPSAVTVPYLIIFPEPDY